MCSWKPDPTFCISQKIRKLENLSLSVLNLQAVELIPQPTRVAEP